MGCASVIVLDTHIWIWWIDDNPRLTQQLRDLISSHQSDGLGVSILSCWEVAKLVEKNRLELSCSVEEWLDTALTYTGVQLLDLTLSIVVQSTQLTGFHKDPADQIIVATAKVYDCCLLTADQKILDYPGVKTLTSMSKLRITVNSIIRELLIDDGNSGDYDYFLYDCCPFSDNQTQLIEEAKEAIITNKKLPKGAMFAIYSGVQTLGGEYSFAELLKLNR